MDLVLSILVLAAIALVLGAIALFRRGGHAKQALLMIMAAAVIAVNVVIWTLPTPDGKSLAGEAARAGHQP